MEGAQLIFRVPWSALCSDNRKYVRGYVLSKQYRDSKQEVGDHAIDAARQWQWSCTTKRVGLRVVVTEPDSRRRDLNWSKNLKDGISGSAAIWVDDCQVRDEHWLFSAHPDRENAGAMITIWILPDQTPRHEHPTRRRRTRHATPL